VVTRAHARVPRMCELVCPNVDPRRSRRARRRRRRRRATNRRVIVLDARNLDARTCTPVYRN
jgi:DNA transposition AAA+ family ATPase